MNRIKDIMENYYTEHEDDEFKDEGGNGKIGYARKRHLIFQKFIEDIRNDEGNLKAISDMVCEDFDIMIDADRITDVLRVVINPRAAIYNIITHTLHHNQDVIEGMMEDRDWSKTDFDALKKTLSMIYSLPPNINEKSVKLHLMLFDLILGILEGDSSLTGEISIIYPDYIDTPAITYKNDIMITLLKGLDDDNTILASELMTDISESIFYRVIRNTWFTP